MTTARQPNEAQLAAVRSYAENEGEGWKAKLRIDWDRAGTDKWHARETYHLLQQLRNNFGPRWLATFEP